MKLLPEQSASLVLISSFIASLWQLALYSWTRYRPLSPFHGGAEGELFPCNRHHSPHCSATKES